ncbi:MAG: sigma-54 dependent transcriptional regulator [Bacteroides sp.]|nr:sigma-54 dependent transcriptional regulator [Bacteroides sp.]
MDLQELQRIKNKFDIIGNDAALTHAIETALAVAPTDLAVLITGESGVGKDVIPRIIHQNSLRKTGKYLAVNCGAIPEGTINAELFGHEKGAFTGAIGERKGYFEEANGGTLFLDEIGELPKETQALLLRVLQNGEYLKVGSSKVEKTDVRVIAATNINLAYAVATGKFREDLYYRLSGIQIKVPALRDRNKDDQYLLFRKFSSDFAEKYNLCKISLSHDAISMLTSYRWPGNIRQLKNVAETVTALESKPMTPGQERIEISADRLEGYIPQEQGSIMVADGTASTGSMNSSEKEQIVKAIFLLKQEVDRIKEKLESMASAGVVSRQDSNVPRLIEEFGKSTGFQQDADFQQNIEHTAPEEEFPKVTSMEEVSDLLIKKCLAKHDGKVKAAAEELGISERTIYRKLAKMKQK